MTAAVCDISVCFKMFDVDQDGRLNSKETIAMARGIFEAKQISSVQTSFATHSAQTNPVSIDDVVASLRKHCSEKVLLAFYASLWL